jgi:hypothetical protein
MAFSQAVERGMHFSNVLMQLSNVLMQPSILRAIRSMQKAMRFLDRRGFAAAIAAAIRSRRPLGELERPASGDWVRTFTIITVPSNELIARIHDRMPAILRPADYERWLGREPDPHDLRQEKNFPVDWKERTCSLCSPAHVLLRGSGGFLSLQIHSVIVTTLSASDINKQCGCEVPTMVRGL